jgi:hypothetical protein
MLLKLPLGERVVRCLIVKEIDTIPFGLVGKVKHASVEIRKNLDL